MNIAPDRVPINIIFPQVVTFDPLEMAQALKLHHETGLASLSTLSGKAGYDFTKELLLMSRDKQAAKSFDLDLLMPGTQPPSASGNPKDQKKPSADGAGGKQRQ
jgi:hypothetical protein